MHTHMYMKNFPNFTQKRNEIKTRKNMCNFVMYALDAKRKKNFNLEIKTKIQNAQYV